MKGKCKLCQKQADLQASHIIPKFAYRWMKETGGPYMRTAKNPNKREQDGKRLPLLCQSCEGKFSKLETYFSKTIFYPFSEEKQNWFEYDERLLRFSLSVLWRVLLEQKDRRSDLPFQDTINHFIEEWRRFLYENKKPNEFCSAYLVFTGIATADGTQPVEGFINYIARSIDATIAFNSNSSFVYVKFGRFMLLAPLVGDFPELKNCKIDQEESQITSSNQSIDENFMDFLTDRVILINTALEAASQKQKDIGIKETERVLKTNSTLDVFKVLKSESDHRTFNRNNDD